jgi:hypothetical protein
MTIVLPIIIVAILIGLIAGGSLKRFENLQIHWWAVAPVGLALQVIPIKDSNLAVASLIASYALLLAFVWVNRRLVAAPLLLIGLVLNLAVVAANGGMPVSGSAIRSVDAQAIAPAADAVGKHHLESSADVLVPLGDNIPVPQPVGAILSIGDLFLYLGIMVFVISVMLGRPGSNRRPPSRFVRMYRGKHQAQAHHRTPPPEVHQVEVPAAAATSGI